MVNLLDGSPESTAALTDSDGTTRLTAGTSANGDGAIVELGYFTGSVSSAGFSGAWIPLSGPASANAGIASTSIGDTDSFTAGAYGFFTAQIDFDAESVDFSSFQDTPPVGARLAVAIYDATTFQAATSFTVATNDAWQWKPLSLLPDVVSINLNAPGTVWLGGEENARRTSEPMARFPGLGAAARLVNISTRGFVGSGDAIMIPGFVVGGTGTTEVLVRAVGPTLGAEPFNLEDVLSDPTLRLITQSGNITLLENDDWFTGPDGPVLESTMTAVGAFALLRSGKDSGLRAALAAGGYTAQISGNEGGTGVALAEIYAVDDGGNTAARIINLSTRGFAGAGDRVMIAGFVDSEGGPRRLLIRAVGPTLAEPAFAV